MFARRMLFETMRQDLFLAQRPADHPVEEAYGHAHADFLTPLTVWAFWKDRE